MATDFQGESTMDYIEKANELWEAYVPESGQATTLQGELLRQIEALRTEAQQNDNINFDEDYAYFCDFILQTLKDARCSSRLKLFRISRALKTIQRYGMLAAQYNRGELDEQEFSSLHKGRPAFAYQENDLYDIVLEGIVDFCEANPHPLPHRPNPTLYW